MAHEKLREYFRSLGVKKQYVYTTELDGTDVQIRTRKPITIIDGVVKGVEIHWDGSHFRVWMGGIRKIICYAKLYNLHYRLYTGEAELWCPPELADKILPRFYAATVRVLKITDARRRELRERMLALHKARSLARNMDSKGGVKGVTC